MSIFQEILKRLKYWVLHPAFPLGLAAPWGSCGSDDYFVMIVKQAVQFLNLDPVGGTVTSPGTGEFVSVWWSVLKKQTRQGRSVGLAWWTHRNLTLRPSTAEKKGQASLSIVL